MQGKRKAALLKDAGKDFESKEVAAGVAAAEEALREYNLAIEAGGRA